MFIIGLAVLFLCGIVLGKVFERLGLPKLVGYIIAGVLVQNVLPESLMVISSDLRQIALIIILLRAGLSLDISDLKKAGRPAVLMCFVPALFEIFGSLLIGPQFFGITLLEAGLLGAVIAAVSPAVVVPSMLQVMEEGYGQEKRIPHMVLAAASIDDIVVIVIFTSLLTVLSGSGVVSIATFLEIPISILTGIMVGLLIGRLLSLIITRVKINYIQQILVLLSISFILVGIENSVNSMVPYSGLLSVMAMGMMLKNKLPNRTEEYSKRLVNIWEVAEIWLFVLVGATVNISYIISGGFKPIIFIVILIVFRSMGTYISLLGTDLTIKEKMFVIISFLPKATVQAAIGGIPLAQGLEVGELVLTIAVLSICITAPIGAIGINKTYKKLLEQYKN